MEEWKEYKLGGICDFREGYVNPPQGNAEYFDGNIKWLRATDLNDGYVYNTSRTLTELGFKSAKKSAILFKPETIAISKSGTIGRLGILKDYMCGNRAVINIIPHDNVDTFFVFYALKSYQKYFPSMAVGSVQKNLYISILEDLKIGIPSLYEQQKIVSVLKSFDDKIEANRRINSNLEQQAQALFKSWFVDFEPFRDKPFVESELGMIPEGWRVICLGEVCKCVLGGTPSRSHDEYWNGDIPWINSGEVNNFRILSPTEYITKEGLEKSATKLLPAHTTVLAITGATLGQVSLLEMESCANQSVIGVLDNPNIPYSFIYPLINFKIKELMSHMTGGAQQHINKDNVEQLKIVLPPQYILKKYACLSVPLFEKISNSCFQSANLAKTRDTLLPRLMSGELKVQEIEESL